MIRKKMVDAKTTQIQSLKNPKIHITVQQTIYEEINIIKLPKDEATDNGKCNQ